MSAEVRHFTATIPAGTDITAPQTIDLTMPPRIVTGVQVVVPPGPAGAVGFRFTTGGVSVIPPDPEGWITSNGEVINWTTDGYLTTGAWQVQAYNDGQYDHTIYIRMLCDPTTAAPGAAVTFAPAATIETPAQV